MVFGPLTAFALAHRRSRRSRFPACICALILNRVVPLCIVILTKRGHGTTYDVDSGEK